MKENHVKEQIKSIKSILSPDGGTMVRKKAHFNASDRQISLMRRIVKVRHRIDSIKDEERLLIFGGDDPLFAFGGDDPLSWLFRLTNLKNKNIVGIARKKQVMDVKYIDEWNGGSIYPICSVEKGIEDADCVLVMQFRNWVPKDQIAILSELGYMGRIVSLYDKEDTIPFYCFKKEKAVADRGCDIYKSVCDSLFYAANEYDLEMLWRIDKLNEKLSVCKDGRTLIYGVGAHTDALFDLTDIGDMNVVALADRDRSNYFDLHVRDVSSESFSDVDHIVISSFQYQSEIWSYLKSIGVGDKVVLLYDETDQWEFYWNTNEYAPDIPAENKHEIQYGAGDVYAILERTMNDVTVNSNYYVTYSMFPDPPAVEGYYYTGEDDLYESKGYRENNAKTAIIIQGPVIFDDDFTYRTILTYKTRFPGAAIILSTWKTEAEKNAFSKFYHLGIEIVLSDIPETRGILNINFQLRSTQAGIIRAKGLGRTYVLKTRSDFRLHEEGVISYLVSIINQYSVADGSRKRIAILPPVMDVAYYVPDFISFGAVDDMAKFWDASDEIAGVLPDDLAEDGVVNPEGVLFARYLKKIGKYLHKPAIRTKEYIHLLCEEFVVVDYECFKYIWKKYSYESSTPFMEQKNIFTGMDWLSMQDSRGNT